MGGKECQREHNYLDRPLLEEARESPKEQTLPLPIDRNISVVKSTKLTDVSCPALMVYFHLHEYIQVRIRSAQLLFNYRAVSNHWWKSNRTKPKKLCILRTEMSTPHAITEKAREMFRVTRLLIGRHDRLFCLDKLDNRPYLYSRIKLELA